MQVVGKAIVRDDSAKIFLKDTEVGEPLHPDIGRYWIDCPYPNILYSSRKAWASDTPTFHKAVTIENQRLVHVQYPDWGGHVLEFRDKKTGTEIFNSNCHPYVIGFFFHQKGSHVFFPHTEHGFNSLEPWPYSTENTDQGVSTIFNCTDDATGLKMNWRTTMPANGYYIDVTATAWNPTSEPQRFMMYILHQMRNGKATRVHIPSRVLTVHTGFPFDKKDPGRNYFRRNTPIPFPFINGKDYSLLENWPNENGAYALSLQDNWCGVHDSRSKRGFVKILDPTTLGVKFFGNKDFTELFSGVNRNLSRYRLIKPNEKITLHERIIPTIGLTCITKANKNGVLAMFRTDSSNTIITEYLASETLHSKGGLLHIEIRNSNGKLFATRDTVLSAGDIAKIAISPVTNEHLTITVTSGKKTQMSYTCLSDSLPLFTKYNANTILPDTLPDLPYTSRKDNLKKDSIIFPEIIPSDTVALYSLTTFFEGTDTKSKEDLQKDTSSKTREIPYGSASAQIGKVLYVLSDGNLLLFNEASNGETGYNWPFRYSSTPAIKIKVGKESWHTDVIAHRQNIVLAFGKRIEIRNRAGAFIDSIGLGDFPAGMLSLDSLHIAVALPRAQAIAIVNIQEKSVKRVTVDTTILRHPWALVYVPNGIVVTSAVSKRIMIADSSLTKQRLLCALKADPLRTRYRGITATIWNDSLKCLIINDADNLNIRKLDIKKGVITGDFISSSPDSVAVRIVRDISSDSIGNLLVTHYRMDGIKRVMVSAYDQFGQFLGSTVKRSGKFRASGTVICPVGNDKMLLFNSGGELTIADMLRNGIVQRSHEGWGRGSGVQWTDATFDKKAGIVLADGEKGVLAHFQVDSATPDIKFINEITLTKNKFSDFYPIGLSYTSNGYLHVLESNTNSIVIFKPEYNRRGIKGFKFVKNYNLPDSTACCQRIYKTNQGIIIGDALGKKLYRFTNNGTFVSTISIPDSILILHKHFQTPDDNLYIATHQEERFLVISSNNSLKTVDQLGIFYWAHAVVDLQEYPEWHSKERPKDARFAVADEDFKITYWTSDFKHIPTDSGIPRWERNTVEFDFIGNKMVIANRQYPGAVIIDTVTKSVRLLQLDIKAKSLRLLKRKNDSIFGAVTEMPTRFIEFTLDGKILSSFDIPRGYFWRFTYTKQGNILIPQSWDSTITEYTPQGKIVKKIPLSNCDGAVNNHEFWMGITLSPDGVIYAQDWSNGRIIKIDEHDSAKVIFGANVKGLDPKIQGGGWLEFIDNEHMICFEPPNGRFHIIGRDGTYYGSYADKKWTWNGWFGKVPQNGVAMFNGMGGIQKLQIQFKPGVKKENALSK